MLSGRVSCPYIHMYSTTSVTHLCSRDPPASWGLTYSSSFPWSCAARAPSASAQKQTPGSRHVGPIPTGAIWAWRSPLLRRSQGRSSLRASDGHWELAGGYSRGQFPASWWADFLIERLPVVRRPCPVHSAQTQGPGPQPLGMRAGSDGCLVGMARTASPQVAVAFFASRLCSSPKSWLDTTWLV